MFLKFLRWRAPKLIGKEGHEYRISCLKTLIFALHIRKVVYILIYYTPQPLPKLAKI